MHAGIAVAETRVPSPPLFCYLLVPHLLCPLPLSPPHLGILPFAPVHIRVFPSVSLSLLLLSLSRRPHFFPLFLRYLLFSQLLQQQLVAHEESTLRSTSI